MLSSTLILSNLFGCRNICSSGVPHTRLKADLFGFSSISLMLLLTNLVGFVAAAMPGTHREHPVAMDDGSALLLSEASAAGDEVDASLVSLFALVNGTSEEDGCSDATASVQAGSDTLLDLVKVDEAVATTHTALQSQAVVLSVPGSSSPAAPTGSSVLTLTESLVIPSPTDARTSQSNSALATLDDSCRSTVLDTEPTMEAVAVHGSADVSADERKEQSLIVALENQQTPSDESKPKRALRSAVSPSHSGSSVPAAVQTVVLSSNGSQQPVISSKPTTTTTNTPPFQPSMTSKWLVKWLHYSFLCP